MTTNSGESSSQKLTANLDDSNLFNGTVTLDESTQIQEETGPHYLDSNWQCGVCGKVFTVEYHMNVHMESAHTDEDIWQCEQCGQTFRVQSMLKEHLDSIHVNAVNRQCKDCGKTFCNESVLKEHTEINHTHINSNKELELLRRRHDALKEKHEEVTKKNKEYAKNLFHYIQENTELKQNAKQDAETLADTLSINQVLVEEIKVKDEIIKANEILIKQNTSTEDVVIMNEDIGNASQNKADIAKCSVCEWTSNRPYLLQGHMLKHTGQYLCDVCDKRFKTRENLRDHEGVHKTVNDESVLTCITCDKQFASEHSIKQHMQSKHSSDNNQRLPVGHPQRYQKVNHPQNIACVQCGEIFPTRRDVDDHMTVHAEENNRNKKDFVNPWKEKTCRYYRNGNCFKGDRCAFKHSKMHEHKTPLCNRGQDCIFKTQNRCVFFHPEIGVQSSQQRLKKECRYKEGCWNISSCLYSHNMQDFRFSGRNTRPPLMVRNFNTWEDY